jgi:biopolymer transport protein ExbD/predicted Ser/Thr protein kinase
VLEYLGRGGMGFVYKAKQAGLDRVVALKVLAPRLAGSPEFAARFGREAKALAALSHPNIVQIFDYGQEAGLYFLVMEYVDGTSLRRILSTQRITPETALRYVPQICDALEFAHTAGVVHRDIKPENILIDKRGGLKIADFGLAKIAAGAPGKPDAVAEPKGHATVSGQVMGTPHYMAPEQVENMAAVDHRADIYSLGVVFYEMLTGELPLGRFPSPSQRVQVDVRFDEVVLKALEKEPEKRYQRASLVKEDLTRIATGAVQGGQPASSPQTSLTKGAVPKTSPSWLKILSIVVLAADIFGLLGLCWAVLATQDTFVGLFSEIDVALPGLTLLVIAVPSWVYVLAFGSLLLVLVAKEFAVRSKAITLGLNSFTLALGLGFLGIYTTAVLLPLTTLWSTVETAPMPQTYSPVTASVVSEPDISWGQPVNGLQLGLEIKQNRIEAGKPVDITLHLRNTGEKDVTIAAVGRPVQEDAMADLKNLPMSSGSYGWEYVLIGNEPSVGGLAHLEPAEAQELTMRKGETRKLALNLGGRERLKGLFGGEEKLPSSGKFRFALHYNHETHHGSAGCPYWHGKITTGEVEIEIVEPGKASAEKPETPAVKDVASHDELDGLFGNRVVESKKRYAAFVVHIDRAGACAIAGAVFAGEALDERIAGAAKKAGFDGTGTVSKLKVVIRAEAQTPYSAIQHTMMACAQARVVDVSLAVGDNEPVPTPLPQDPGFRPDGTSPELPPEVRIRLFREKPDGPVLCLLPGNVELSALPAEEALKAVADNKTAWKGAAIVIAADADVPFEAVARVLDACIKASLTRIVFSVPAPAPSP